MTQLRMTYAWFVLTVALMFMLLYNISFLRAPSISTGRVAIALLMAATGWRGLRSLLALARANHIAFLVFVAALVYAVILYLATGMRDAVQMSRCFHFLLFSLCGAELFALLLGYDVVRFASVFASAVFVQALLILYSYVSPEYRVWLSGVLVQSGAIPLTYGLQVPGFSNSSGAALSTIQGAGVFSALYAARFTEAGRRSLLLSMIPVIVLSTIVTGRTGLIASVVFVAAFVTATSRWQNRVAIACAALGGWLLVAQYSDAILSAMIRLNPSFGSTIAWGLGVFSRGASDPVLNDLVSQPVPRLTVDTVLGTGLVADAYGNASQNDSGYIQTYYALGLLVAVLFYGALLAFLGKYVLKSREPFLLGVLVASLFVVEYKEPFIFKYALPFFAIGLTRLQALRTMALRQPGPAV